jgi:hypothetical protein
VSCVMLRANGKQEQLQLDTSPRKRQAEEFLGAACTMLGEWSDQQVVLIARQDYETEGNSAAPLSTHKLQPPFHAFKVHGDILLMKLGEDSLPLNYTLKEYEAFQALEIEEWEIEEEDDDEEDEEDEEGGDGDGDGDAASGDEEDDSEEFAEHLFMQLVEKFKKEHGGRDPTEAQLKELEVQVGQMIEEMAGGDDDEDDDSGDDEEDEDEEEDDDEDDDDDEEDEEEDDE